MALAVDAAGKVRAFNNNATRKNSSGTSALQRALDPGNQLRPWENVPNALTPGTETPGQALDRASSSNQVRQSTRPSASPRTSSFVMPTVGTASMSTPMTTSRKTKETSWPTFDVQTSSMSAPKPVAISGGDSGFLSNFWESMKSNDKAQMSDDEMLQMVSELNANYGNDEKTPAAQASGLMKDTQIDHAQAPQTGDTRIVNGVEQEYHDPSLPGEINETGYLGSYSGYTPYNDSYEDYFGSLGMNPVMLDEMRAPTRTGSASILHPSSVFDVDDGTMDSDHLTSGLMTGSQYIRYKESLGDLAGSRPIEEIEDSDYAIYDKMDEFNRYGFVPYVPTDDIAASYNLGSIASAPRKGAANLATLRENVGPEVTITMNANDDNPDNDVTFSNSDFERRISPFFVRWNDIWNNDQKSLLHPPADTEDYTTWVHEYSVPTDDGGVEYHYGELLDMSPTGGPEGHGDDEFDENGNYIGTWTLSFSDGTQQTVSSDTKENMIDDEGYIRLDNTFVTPDEMAYPVSNTEALNTREYDRIDGDSSPGVYYTPDLVLSDGTRINVFEAQDIYHNKADDVRYNGITSLGDAVPVLGNIPVVNLLANNISNKPNRLIKQEMIGSGGVTDPSTWDFSDAANNTANWTLGSLPISAPGVVPWVVSASQALPSLAGVNGSSYNPLTGSYRMISEDPYLGRLDEDGKLEVGSSFWNGLGTLSTPLTEMIAGPVGVDPFWGKASGKFIDKSLKSPVSKFFANKAAGAAGEGFEEVVGNVFEDLTNYGTSGAFANPIYQTDEYGNVILDPDTNEPMIARDQASYNELRDENTPLQTRVANFLDLDNGGQDPINSFLGGALVDTVLDNLPFVVDGGGVHVNNESLIPGYLNARQQRQGYRNIRDTGGRVFVPGEYGNMNLSMPGQTEE